MSDNIDPEKAALLLADCVSSVFADMAFIDVRQSETAAAVEDERCVAIDILAPVSCRIELRISRALRDKIVENLFGEAPDSVQKKNGEDSILEMLNIITGAFLSAYFGAGTEIQLELPQYLYFEEQSPGSVVSKVFMNAEGESLNITLSSVRYRY